MVAPSVLALALAAASRRVAGKAVPSGRISPGVEGEVPGAWASRPRGLVSLSAEDRPPGSLLVSLILGGCRLHASEHARGDGR